MKMARKGWGSLALVALLAGVLYFVLRSDAPLAEIVDVAAEGGEKLLRETLRPAGGGPRVLLLALDGVGEDELRAALRSGGLPRLGALTGEATADPDLYAHGYVVPNVLSVLPSTTYAAWASLYTGEPPGRTGVPGNEWFAREEARFYAPAPVSVEGTEDAVKVYSEGLVGRVLRVPTLFERADVRSYVSLAAVHRGADLLTTPDPGAIADLAAASVEGLTGEDDVEQEVYEELDLTAVESLLETLSERGVPDLQVVYFPGVDLYTHVASPPLGEQREYLREVIDPAVGRILEEYRRQAALDDTHVVIVSDHGHTPVLDDDRHSLGTGGEDEPGAVLERAGFRVRPFELEELDEEEEDFQAVLAYQGAFAYVYLADRSTCPEEGDRCDWSRPPRLVEDVLPVAAAFHRASATGAGVPQLRGTLDLVLARPPRAPGREQLPFQVFDGRSLVPISEYLARTPRPELLDLERRLEGLATGPRGHLAGDVVLLARTGLERPIEERFYFSGRYRSWHGSPTAQDSRISLLIAHPTSTGEELRVRLTPVLGPSPTQLDVVPLVLELLGRSGREAQRVADVSGSSTPKATRTERARRSSGSSPRPPARP